MKHKAILGAMVNKTFGRVLVIWEQHRTPGGHVICHYNCQCGNRGTARASDLRRGRVTSCGCALVDSNKQQPHALGKRWKRTTQKIINADTITKG